MPVLRLTAGAAGVRRAPQAPDLVTTEEVATGVRVDVALRQGTGGAAAGVAKAAVLRWASRASRHFRPLVLAVKWWAARRGLIDPVHRQLNSFTWALMALFFLQRIHLAPAVGPAVEPSDGAGPTGTNAVAAADDAEDGAAEAAAADNTTQDGAEPKAAERDATGHVDHDAAATTATVTVTEAAASAHPALSATPAAAAELGVLLMGFFGFWRQFACDTDAVSVRIGATIPVAACTAGSDGANPDPGPAGTDVAAAAAGAAAAHTNQATNGRVEAFAADRGSRAATADPGVDGRPAARCFVVEDPVEPDENTARTLADRHLEELRAELNRGYTMLAAGAPFSAVAAAPPARKLPELKQFFLPPPTVAVAGAGAVDAGAGAAAGGADVVTDVVAGLPVGPADRAGLTAFVALASPATFELAGELGADARKAVHHACEMLGIVSARVGRQGRKGEYRLRLTKPDGWSPAAVRAARPAPWTPLETAALRERLRNAAGSPTLPPDGGPAPADSDGAGLRTVALLRGNLSLEQLVRKYRLVARGHSAEPLVQLSYSQTESSMASPVVRECRGLLLERGSWRVVAAPFFKFFNFGEKHAAQIDWDTAVVCVPPAILCASVGDPRANVVVLRADTSRPVPA